MGTNENDRNINEINPDFIGTNNTETIENTENTNVKVIDFDATQRIDFLGDLIKNNDKTITNCVKQQNENNVEENENIDDEDIVDIDENVVEDNHNNCDINESVINTNEINNEVINIENSSSEISTEPIAHAENCSEISNDNVQKNPNQVNNEQNVENVISKTKEEQHAQDKKDYRLERMLFERINKMQGKIKESLELIKKFERINAKEENLPNIVTTLHDKLTQEVIKQFRTVGIEFNMKSYLVQAVVSDLLGKFEEGITEFKDCSENLNFVREVQEDFESRVELAPTSKVKNIFARLRGMFKPERKQEKLEELERERQEKKLNEANIHLIKYKVINNELEKYTIKKNIVNSLKREIIYGQSSGLTMNLEDFISQKIAPEMQKLGLESCVSELEKSVFEEYKSKNNQIAKEIFYGLPISEIRRGIKIQKMDMLRSKVQNTVNSNTHSVEDEEELAI